MVANSPAPGNAFPPNGCLRSRERFPGRISLLRAADIYITYAFLVIYNAKLRVDPATSSGIYNQNSQGNEDGEIE